MENQTIGAFVLLLINALSRSGVFGLHEACRNSATNLSLKVDRSWTYLDELVFINEKNGLNKEIRTCSHPTKPVKWELYSPNSHILDVILNIYWRNATGYYFGSLTINPISVNNNLQAIFTCRSTGNESDPCESLSFIFTNSFVNAAQGFVEMPKPPASTDYGTSTNGCEFVLRYRVKGKGNLEYKWETTEGEKATINHTITKTASPDYFQGLYATEPERPDCVKLLDLNETQNCAGCKVVGNKIGQDYEVLAAVIFRADFANSTFVAKGVFDAFNSLVDQRNFYWNWEVQPEQMIKVNAPSVFFVNKPENVTCSVSGIFFAVGAALNLTSLEKDGISRFSETAYSEIYKPIMSATKEHGMRELTHQFVFHRESQSEVVVCSAPLIDFSRVVLKRFVFSVITPTVPVILEPSYDQRLILNAGETHELECRARATPLAEVHWTSPVETVDLNPTVTENKSTGETTSKFVITNFHGKYEGTYRCNASNHLGIVARTVNLQLPKGLSMREKMLLIGGLGGVAAVFVFVLGMMYRKIALQRRKYESETDKAKQDFLQGTFSENKAGSVGDLCDMKVPENITSESQPFQSQPFDHRFSVPLENWSIDDNILGMGNFGVTRKAKVSFPSQEPVEVAVKTLLNAENIDEFRRFLYELKLMQCLSYHPNIVSLVACCIENIDQRDVLIGVELCSKGNLGDYLRKHGPKLNHFIQNNSSQVNCNAHNNLDVVVSPECLYLNLESNNDLTDIDLYTWSLQIAIGMEFLASKNVLHGDLAVRNILLTFDKVAKISDFGLSRHLDENLSYKKKSQVAVPWKYLALESLTACNFSTKSDVWAFGITMWEIFSLGKTPYAGTCMGEEFVNNIRNGMRLKKPDKATIWIYELMTECWHDDPINRPCFTDLKNQFTTVVEQLQLQDIM